MTASSTGVHRRPPGGGGGRAAQRGQVDAGQPGAPGSRLAVVEDTPGVTRDRVAYDAELARPAVHRGRHRRLGAATARGLAARDRRAGRDRGQHRRRGAVRGRRDGRRDRRRRGGRATCCAAPGKPVVLAANKVDDAARGGRRRRAVVARAWASRVRSARCTAGAAATCSTPCWTALPERHREPRRRRGRPAPGGADRQAQRRQVEPAQQAGRRAAGRWSTTVAGTTRDPVDELIELGGETWRFVDTAGHPAPGPRSQRRGVLRQRCAPPAALEAGRGRGRAASTPSEPLTEQDLRIIADGRSRPAGRWCIAFNKWDLVDEERRDYLEREIDRELVHGRAGRRG